MPSIFDEMNDRTKNESNNVKFGKGFCSAIALIYTGTITFFLYDHYVMANKTMNSEDPEVFGLYCIDESAEAGIEANNYLTPLLETLRINFLIQLGLTIGTILTIVASFLPHFRCCNVLIWTFGNVAHLVGLLMLTMFRFGNEAEMCATAESAAEAGRKVD